MLGIGIDFGTTNSVMAFYDGKKSEPLLNEIGEPHPSVVWFQGDQVRVGHRAKTQFNAYVSQSGNLFVRSIKRTISPDGMMSTPAGMLPTWKVASHIFSHLRKQAAEKLGEVQECVVTVPVYFDGQKRAAIRRAAEEAGLYIKAFVHEPFAAFVGFLESLPPAVRGNIRNVLVFDWGGGTLDITLVSARGGEVFEQGTGGISDRAGDDFDQLVEGYLKQQFMSRYRLNADEFVLPPSDQDRLAFEAERRKIELSRHLETEAALSNFYRLRQGDRGQVVQLQERITRGTFEALIARDIDAAMHQVELTMEKAGISADEVDRVLMIGGTSLVPAVAEALRLVFGPFRVVGVPNAPTIIAEGAAIVAHHDWKPYLVYPLGVRLSDDTYHPVFDAGSVLLPDMKVTELTFYCTDHRDGVARLIIAEQKRHKEWLTKCLMPIKVNPTLRNTRVERVHTEFMFDEDLILRVSGYGSVEAKRAYGQVHDLCFGLRRQ